MWIKRTPQSFPAHFGRILIEAVTFENQPVLFGSYRTKDETTTVSDQFRYFRWCLRQLPEHLPRLTQLEREYQFRLSTARDLDWFIISLTATPNRIEQIAALNPHLIGIISAEAS